MLIYLLLLPSYKVIDAVSNGIIIPITKSRYIVVLVSAFITLLRFKRP